MKFNFVLISTIICSIISAYEATCPAEVYERSVNSADAEVIVKAHNDYRSMILEGKVPNQPKGVNLLMMKWDKSLAEAAQKIADTCEFAHVPVHDDRWSWVGQNLYMTMSSAFAKGSLWKEAAKSWYDEHSKFQYPNKSTGVTGHYTQVVWAKSDHLGCGYTFYHVNSEPVFKYNKLYVCNYGPGGNYNGQAPYELAN